jgi:phage baseplate assembly protein W
MIISPVLKKKDVIYSDLRKDMYLNPINGDVSRYVDEDAIKESIKNILLTNPGERLFNPDFGTPIRRMLFENILFPETKYMLQDLISTALKNYEPRCDLISVDVKLGGEPSMSSEEAQNSVNITVTFSVINIQTPLTLTVVLNRVR